VPPFGKIFRLTTGSVANGGFKEDSWPCPHPCTLKKVHVTPRGNSPMTNVQFYLDRDGTPIITPDMPAEILDPVNPQAPLLNQELVTGSKLNYKLTNNSGAAETYDISLVTEVAEWPPK